MSVFILIALLMFKDGPHSGMKAYETKASCEAASAVFLKNGIAMGATSGAMKCVEVQIGTFS